MSGIQQKATRHTKEQGNTTQNEEKSKLIKTGPGMALMT